MSAFTARLVGAADEARARLKALVLRNARLRRVLYQVRNRRTFADLHMHDIMLADGVRVDAYEAALKAHLGPDDTVVDLGTGTGVLALLAARSAREVHAIEHGPIIDAARAVAAENGVTNVRFHRTHSREFTLPGGADAIVHEQLGSALFNEDVVANIADLRDRVLRPGGRIYPALLELFVEPVQLRDEMRFPPAWQQEVHGIRFDALRPIGLEQPFDYWYKLWRPFPLGTLLCRPEPVLTVDLMTAVPSDLPHEIHYARPATRPGTMDGYCVYFTARFDDRIAISTSPEDPMTSWATPFLRVESRPVAAGEPIRLDLRAGDLATPETWRWR